MSDKKELTPSQDKNRAALTSVIAAVGLTAFKIIVGLLTGSLGILAEAAHSALDLVAALVTFFAVKLSAKDPDKEHPYGHGKIENLSALFETLLLLGTCVWIVYEAVNRLSGKPVEVDITVWAFVVMATSIVIDFSRSRILYAASRRHNSQALEADALHFSTDIWSSCVVILGLILVKVSELVPGFAWLRQADSIAALGVSAIVVYVSIQMGIRTIQGLLDTSPVGMDKKIKAAAESVDGVSDCHKVRVRMSGPTLFADAHIRLNPRMTVEKAHQITMLIEKKVKEQIPGLELTIHIEPVRTKKL
jgi:cation diffusion facilitator family transporter